MKTPKQLQNKPMSDNDNPFAIADLPWSLLKKNLEPGRWLELIPLTFARVRLIVTDGRSVFDGW